MLAQPDSERLTAAALARLTEAVGRIQATQTLDASLALLAGAAADLVSAGRVTIVDRPDESVKDAVAFPLVASGGESLGVLWAEPKAGASFSAVDRTLLGELARLGSWAIENVQLKRRLVAQDERLRLALQAASLGTWEHIPSTHATFWDTRSKAIFGCPPEEELDYARYTAALHPDDIERVYAGINKSMDPAGSGECSLQYRIRGLDGVERWVEAHGRCEFAGDVPQRINGTLLDITERKQAEQAVRDAVRRKDEFLALLGHELRNPLAPIRTALDLMRLRHPDHAVREREVIDRQVRHMIRLVDDLLDLARVARGSITLKREPSALSLAVARAVEIASPLFEERKHRLELEIPADLWVDVDSVRFSQLVANLLTNAAKFTPRGGHVWVRGRAEAGEVVLEIEDDGVGIEPAQLALIFEPFVQAGRGGDQGNAGLGLGLSLVRDLVALHGGRVAAESAGIGRGSRFVVHLPAGTRRGIPPQKQAEPEPAKPVLGRRVLLVDDNEDAAEMLAQVLTDLGHSVRVAHDGPHALELAAELEPDVAVLDIGLPVMDGYELAQRLLDAHGARGLRLVAITGYGQAEDKARTKKAGFHHHLVKPVETKELEAALAL